MSNVYVVTSGEYSDYSIERVFSTRALAEAYVNGDPDMRVEEYPLDDKPGLIMRPIYVSEIDLDGEIRRWNNPIFREAEERYSEVYEHPYAHQFHGRGRFVAHFTANSAVSQEHADKLAVEARQKWLRERNA